MGEPYYGDATIFGKTYDAGLRIQRSSRSLLRRLPEIGPARHRNSCCGVAAGVSTVAAALYKPKVRAPTRNCDGWSSVAAAACKSRTDFINSPDQEDAGGMKPLQRVSVGTFNQA
jgi:hypothetical protein